MKLFSDLFQVYGFPVNQLFDMLLEIRDQYSETLLKKWAGIFRWGIAVTCVNVHMCMHMSVCTVF